MRNEGSEKVERFRSGGLATGVIGLVATAFLLLYGVLVPDANFAPWAWSMVLLIGLVIWVVLVRPAVVVRGEVLELREIVHSWWIPLARVTDVEVTHVTRVTADGRTITGSGMGRSRRQIGRDARMGEAASLEKRSVGWLVEEKLRRLAANARDAAGGTAEEPPAIRRTWAWPEIVGLVVLAVATLVLLVLG